MRKECVDDRQGVNRATENVLTGEEKKKSRLTKAIDDYQKRMHAQIDSTERDPEENDSCTS